MHLQKCQSYKIYLSQESFYGGDREGHVIFIPEDNIQEIGILEVQTIRVQDWPCWIMSSF